MLEVLKILISGGLLTCICICSKYILEFAVALLICLFPKLSNEKVNAITKMVSRHSSKPVSNL